MRAAIYARVSTADRDQNVETQLLPLREFVAAQGWEVAGEFVDHAPATDLRRRTAWREMLDLAAKRKIDLVLVWRIDRAFRSLLDAAGTLERLRGWGVGIRSYQEPWIDTTSPFGEAMFGITAVWAQLERAILRERVKAGMDRARREGKHIGRRFRSEEERIARQWPVMLRRIEAGEISMRGAAKELRVSEATVRRMVAGAAAIIPESSSRESL